MSSAAKFSFVTPGQPITTETGFLRGHGSYLQDSTDTEGPQLVASIAGEIERVNKLISVRPVKARYIGEIGDLVVGRISAVESKRWRADINGQKDAMLQLSSVNLPGGQQRIRTYEDQLQMRTLYTESDLISAEIQNITGDGSVSLHTRSLKYGKLENGQLICVPSALIRRLPQHYVSLPWGIDVILGKNGYIWITRSIPEEWKALEADADEALPTVETLQRLRKRHADTPLLPEERMKVCRVRNAIYVLSQKCIQIYPDSIVHIYRKSVDVKMEPKKMILPLSIDVLTQELLSS